MLKKLSQFIDNTTESKSAGHSQRRGSFPHKSGLKESFDFLSLIRAWKDIAGAKLSEHTIPLKNQNGILIVLSNHSAFANELSYMELPLKKKIFDKFPSLEKSISSIKFIVDSTHFSQQYQQFITPIEKKMRMALHPQSPEFKKLKKEAEIFFLEINDQDLKERMISLYIQSFSK